ncbi:MAG: 4Fe-4S dicluster domain-containing protein [Spartobacteria bacterium]|nr:4Fe-4S dicluster domain-containing protein [Spartobacteria bacterium]
MNYDNYADRLRREILIRVAQAVNSDDPESELDHIAVDMRPRDYSPVSRCCIYKDRAMIKYRCMAALGFSIENEVDEARVLSDYYREAVQRPAGGDGVLTIINEACTGCVRSRYVATDACRGCIAHPCIINCPRQAIEMVNGQAEIDPAKCINCGICMQACPYHAIIRVPIPCEEACPVGAITKDETGRVAIDFDKCTFCGKCAQACPFAAIVAESQLLDVLQSLRSNKKVIAIIAPAVIGQFPGTMAQFFDTLKTIGFDDVVEVAFGAEETVRQETAEWQERMERGDAFMTTSCCPAYVEAAHRHIPELEPFVSHTPSPMVLCARQVKKVHPEACIVFVGPCIAKRYEAIKAESVDYVLTFDELGAMLVALGGDVQASEETALPMEPGADARGFAASGGVTEAIRNAAPDGCNLQPVQIDGLDKKSIAMLRAYAKKKQCPGNFIEVMSCQGGCIAGPRTLISPKKGAAKLKEFVKNSPRSNML